MSLDIRNTTKVEQSTQSSKLRTHQQLGGKVQVFLQSGLEAVKWPEPTMLGKKGINMG